MGQASFSRVVGAWNTLLGKAVETNTIMVLMKHFGRHIDIQGLEGYRSCGGRCTV